MQSKSIGRLVKGMSLAGLLGFSATLVWAQSGAGNIADNLAPVGEVCLAGDPCSAAPSNSTPANSTPAPAAVSAPAAAAAPAMPADPAPAAAAAVADDFDVAGTYQMRCFACHGTGAAGAPMLGDADAWGERMAKGRETVMANAINGIGAMPARGLCMDCTDAQISALIDYLVEGQ